MAQIVSAERVKKYGEVFTDQREVDAMLDMLPPETFEPAVTFLEPCCGEGIFVLEILRRKFAQCKTKANFRDALRSVYAMDIQADNVEKTILAVTELCESAFRLNQKDRDTIRGHVIQADSLKIMAMMKELNAAEAEAALEDASWLTVDPSLSGNFRKPKA